jgi:D-3-phosphoglycerate dehydrogenase / 2-oxoglutarate reductase
VKVAITCAHLIRDLDHWRPAMEAAGLEVVAAVIPGQHLEGDELVAAMRGCVGVVAGDDKFTAEVQDQLPDLRVISKWGIGVDGIDREYASDRGIAVTNTPGAFDDEVADIAMAYTIMLLRQLVTIHETTRDGGWLRPAGHSLGDLRLGVVGLGGIGRAVVRRAAVAASEVVGFDPSVESQDLAEETGARIVDLDELMSTSDVVSVNAPSNPSTYHLVNAERLALMRPGSYLVNTGRGDVVATRALADALISGHLAGAAVDVLEEEPPAADNPIRLAPNVIFGSHNASNTYEASARVHRRSISNMARELGVPIELP